MHKPYDAPRETETHSVLASIDLDQIRQIVEEETDTHQGDIKAAVQSSISRIRKLPDYQNYVDYFVHQAIQLMVHTRRHHINVNFRRNSGKYNTVPKTIPGAAVAAVARSVYAYNISGRLLGDILGEELKGISEIELAKASGCAFNAKLCKALIPLVPKGKRVREAVKKARLEKIFSEVK